MPDVSVTADALVVFGITGDLARRMTLPALYRLTAQGFLPCPVVGVGTPEAQAANAASDTGRCGRTRCAST